MIDFNQKINKASQSNPTLDSLSNTASLSERILYFTAQNKSIHSIGRLSTMLHIEKRESIKNI